MIRNLHFLSKVSIGKEVSSILSEGGGESFGSLNEKTLKRSSVGICLRGNMSFFATALVREGIEGETSHYLLTCPWAKLSPEAGFLNRGDFGAK